MNRKKGRTFRETFLAAAKTVVVHGEMPFKAVINKGRFKKGLNHKG